MTLLLDKRFFPYRHEIECLIQTLHGPNVHVDSDESQTNQVQIALDDDDASVAVLTDFVLRLEQMTVVSPQSVNELIHAALEFPKDTPCIFPIEMLYKGAEGNLWLTRAVAEFEKNDPTSRRLAGFLCGLELEQQLQKANWGNESATIGQRLATAGVRKLKGYQDIDFVKADPKIGNLHKAMQLVRALRIRNDSVHVNSAGASQSEIETLIITTSEIEEILGAT